jgi:hypothetical protein
MERFYIGSNGLHYTWVEGDEDILEEESGMYFPLDAGTEAAVKAFLEFL